MIRAPSPPEIQLLPHIENAADERYRRVGLARVLAMPPASIASLEAGRRDGRLWVAVSPRNRPVGFALMKLVGGTAWLDQLSVLDRWQGRGLGAALIERTAAEARRRGHDSLHLSTYRDVPWNGPYYARRGFVELPRSAWSSAFRRGLANESGHPPWRRIIMRRTIGNVPPKITSRESALRNIKVGDLFNAAGDHGAPLICLATSITETTIHARTVTQQFEFKFDRRTGVGKEDEYSIGGTINSVEPLPPEIHEALIGLDQRHQARGSLKLTKEEVRALSFLDDFYDAHPI
jgi:GNAT superfamily N-acetyltransferase